MAISSLLLPLPPAPLPLALLGAPLLPNERAPTYGQECVCACACVCVRVCVCVSVCAHRCFLVCKQFANHVSRFIIDSSDCCTGIGETPSLLEKAPAHTHTHTHGFVLVLFLTCLLSLSCCSCCCSFCCCFCCCSAITKGVGGEAEAGGWYS